MQRRRRIDIQSSGGARGSRRSTSPADQAGRGARASAAAVLWARPAGGESVVAGPPMARRHCGRNLVRLRDLVEAPRGRTGLFFRLPGRGGHLGGAATKWGGRGRAPAGQHARGGASSGAALTFTPGRATGAVFFSRGVPAEISDKWLDRAGRVWPTVGLTP
jgi:hypothetical protein